MVKILQVSSSQIPEMTHERHLGVTIERPAIKYRWVAFPIGNFDRVLH